MKLKLLTTVLALLLVPAGLCAQDAAPAPKAPNAPAAPATPGKKAIKPALGKAAPAAPAKPKRTRKAAPKGKQVDLNHASKAELMALPGITPELAEKIIKGRPYLSKTHIVTHNVVPQATYLAISHQIMVVIEPAWMPKK